MNRFENIGKITNDVYHRIEKKKTREKRTKKKPREENNGFGNIDL